MGLRGRVKKLEREVRPLYDVLRLSDGSEISYTSDDAQAAFFAVLEQEEHWLLPYFRRAEKKVGLPGLIWALEGPVEVADEPEE